MTFGSDFNKKKFRDSKIEVDIGPGGDPARKEGAR